MFAWQTLPKRANTLHRSKLLQHRGLAIIEIPACGGTRQPRSAADDIVSVEANAALCNEFEHYGWRRVRGVLRQKGTIVNQKKIRRLMREHDLQPKMRRRFTATTDSDHNQPIFPNLARDIIPDGPDRLWVADITYVTIVGDFAYVAVVLDAWSRRFVGYAISRSIGCVHLSDRGSQYAATACRDHLVADGLVGSMGRRSNPYDNAKAERFTKTLKVGAVQPMAFETFVDITKAFHVLEEVYNCRRLHSALGYLSTSLLPGRDDLPELQTHY